MLEIEKLDGEKLVVVQWFYNGEYFATQSLYPSEIEDALSYNQAQCVDSGATITYEILNKRG